MIESKMTKHKNSLRVNNGTCSVRYFPASRIMFCIGSFTSLIKNKKNDFRGYYMYAMGFKFLNARWP